MKYSKLIKAIKLNHRVVERIVSGQSVSRISKALQISCGRVRRIAREQKVDLVYVRLPKYDGLAEISGSFAEIYIDRKHKAKFMRDPNAGKMLAELGMKDCVFTHHAYWI